MKFSKEIKKHLKNLQNPTFTIKTHIPVNYLKTELLASQYTLASLKSYIENVNKYIEIQLFNIKIHMIYHDTQFIPKLLLKRVIKRLYIISKICNINKDIIYWFLPIQENRFFPKDGDTVKAVSINGGYTYPTENEIFIYRFEDFAKVMIHELLHHSIIESNTEWSDEQLNNLKHYFNVSKSCKLLPNEALVEVWATYFQLLFISIENNISFKKLYDLESNWGLQQTYRLLAHKQKLNPDAIWMEETNAFTYIVFKTIFLIHLNKFLKIKVPYNSIDIYNFVLKYRNLQLYKIQKNNKSSMRISLFGNL